MSSDLTPPHGEPLDFDALALMHLDGALDPVQHDDFSRQIANDPAKATRLAIIAELHASLGELGHTSMTLRLSQQLDQPLSQSSGRTAGSISTRTHRRAKRGLARAISHRAPVWGLAVAALLAIGVIVGLILPRSSPDTLNITQGSVTLERGSTRQRLNHGSTVLKPGDRILTGRSSNSHITSSDGDRLDLTSGTYLTWINANAAVDLRTGSFIADITPRPAHAPFLVKTPTADLVVVGTRFTVQADEALSLLAVDHGRVRLTNRDDARQVEVAANQLTVTTGAGDLAVTTGTIPPTATTGLTGDYFDHADFTGWRLRRIDATIDFDWDTRGPDPRIGFDSFSTRWRGWLIPPVSGTYTLTFFMDDGVRLWLDGRLVLDEWHLTEKLEFTTTVTLEGGRPYPLRLDYFQDPAFAVIRWYAAVNDQPRQIVPSAWLRPAEWAPPAE